MSQIPAITEDFRKQYRSQEIGPRYSGWAHFAFTSIGSLSVIVFAVTRIHDVAVWEWVIVPAAFLFANFAEYRGHMGPMHHPLRGMKILFQRHTLEHHKFFTHRAMAYESSRDFKMVLFPPVMLFFFLGVIATPIALGLFWLTTTNVGWLFVVVAMAYFLTYEWLHFAYHLDESSWVGRLPAMKALRRHHTRHHDPALMGKWNFNITFPICDWIFGTYYRPSEPRS